MEVGRGHIPSRRSAAARLSVSLAGGLAALLCALAASPPAPAATYGDCAPIPFLLLPASNPWNARVDALPLDPNSDDYIAHMSPETGLHPDFGTVWEGARIGIPYVVVPGTQPKVPIHFTEYGDESDPGPYPVPPDAPVEGTGGPYADGDRHVLVLDADERVLYELYHAVKRPDGSWDAGSGAVFDLTSNALRPDGWTSADAAGLPILPGLARYDEIVGEGVLDHALRFTVAETQRAYVYPATHFASDAVDPDLPPMGLRVRLRADFDVTGFPPVVQTILVGLQRYGMMVADNGSDWFVTGAPDPRWDDEALHELDRVTGADFEVVDSRALLPAGLSVTLPASATALEGTEWSCEGSFADPSGTRWSATVDYDGDEQETLPLTIGADGHGGSFTVRHTWPDDGPREVQVAVANDVAEMVSATVSVAVANVAPAVSGGGEASVRRGGVFTRTCSFGDPGADTWSGWVRYGDGTGRQTLRLRADQTFRLRHRYAVSRGRCTVTLCVTDDDDGRGFARFVVAVR